jgi:hypothetical protein
LAVELIPGGREKANRCGPVGSVHEARLYVSPQALSRVLTTRFLAEIADAYHRFLGRISFGVLRVRPGWDRQSLVVLLPAAVLLRFRAPGYREGSGWAEISWGIDRGILVASKNRGRGSLRIRIERDGGDCGERHRRILRMRMEVAGYYPRIRGGGWFAPFGAWIYGHTQAQVHRLVLRGFMASLDGLEVPTAPTPAAFPAKDERP